jgi:hypothetical protein
MRNCKCGLLFAAGLCCCGLAIASAERAEYDRPSAPACSSPPIYRDFGPPAGCDNDMSPHNRMGWLTSVASSTSTVTSPIFVTAPTVAYTFRDLEEAAAAYEYDLGFEVAWSTSGASSAVIDREINLIHPSKDERLALIRQSRSKGETS